MKKAIFVLYIVMIFTFSVVVMTSLETAAASENKMIDSETMQFIKGNWKVKTFLGFQMITKDDIEYPDGEKILGKEVIVAPGLFSTKEFAPEYEKYAVDLWNGHYKIVDELSGAEFYSKWKVGQEVTNTNDDDKVILIQAESEDGSLSGPMLIDVNHERLLLYLNCDFFELGKNFWTENNMDISIFDVGTRDDGYEHVYYQNNKAELVLLREKFYLLMINGGFMPYPDIKIVNGRALAPVKVISELPEIEVKQDDKNQTLTLIYGETKISLKIDSTKASVNGDMKELDAAPTVIKGEVYVPIRFVAEALGADVEYITGLSNGGVVIARGKSGGDVSSFLSIPVVSIEMPGQPEKNYSPEEGLLKVKEASAVAYQGLLDYYKLDNRTFDNKFNKDYDSQDITFTEQVYGRYYVYSLSAFPEYNIFFNKYTGEIFSEKAGLPFLSISKGFINISWMYQ